jgi:hypothetical protein
MTSFIFYEDEKADEHYILDKLVKHTKILSILEKETGISFANYMITMDEIKASKRTGKKAINEYINFGKQQAALKKYIHHMTEHKGVSKREAQERFWNKIKTMNLK